MSRVRWDWRSRSAMCVVAIALAQAPRSALAVTDPSCGDVEVTMRSGSVVYPLGHPFIRFGSDSVWLGPAPWVAGTDYVLNRVRGELRLLREPIPGARLRVRACWLLAPPPLEMQRIHFRPLSPVARGESGGDSTAAPVGFVSRPVTDRDPGAAPSGAVLSLTGNKTIAVDFGSNQDAALRQSLDLAVSGTLAPGVELTGVLSDRNAPLTSTGTTQNLEALDRVLIELKAPQGSAALGDVSLQVDQGEFGRIERRLQGMSGSWNVGSFRTSVAAASAPGEFHRLQFVGVEGRQGPYDLTDRDGAPGVSVVAGSEVVTVDGMRLTRGESADYSMDYERGRITFSNRRPITANSRITVDYQYSVNRYRRNLLAAGGRYQRGGVYTYVQGLTETDDRGRPLDRGLAASDLLALAAAGDSAVRALGSGVVAGSGDYDTVRVVGGAPVFAFAGRDSGQFSVQFARVDPGQGAYADSTVIDGRTVFRYVGEGRGDFRIGRSLPLPESHQLWTTGGGGSLGPLKLELEGAMSSLDRNVFSSRDDADNRGQAARLALSTEGAVPGGTAGLAFRARAVGESFAPFSRLERPFAEEDWGLPFGADLEHQRRGDLAAFFRPRSGGEMRAVVSRLALPGGFTGWRREGNWSREGTVTTHAIFERADGVAPAVRYADGGRQRMRGDLRLRLKWLEPGVEVESDVRRAPSDTGRVGDRQRMAGVELATGRMIPWRMMAGYALRRDARATATGFDDQNEARTVRLNAESPSGARFGASVALQRRDLVPIASQIRTRSDLGSVRVRADDAGGGLSGLLGFELTSEGESQRIRRLEAVGPGAGAYDSLGNYVGVGNYRLLDSVSPDLDRIARAATSATVAWRFGRNEAWRGSRVEFDFESEARRRGEMRPLDPFVSPGAVLTDPSLYRGGVTQRLEAELAPGSRAAAMRLRAERRVASDRTYENFAQTTDDRTLSARWRARPTGTVTSEVESRWQRQAAAQSIAGGGSFARVLWGAGGTAQLVFTPDARLRAAAVLDASWARPEFRRSATRTVRIGPDVGVQVGARGRADVSARRAFVSGPPAVSLIPSAVPADAPRWEGSTRFDYRVHESTTLGLSVNGRERHDRSPLVTGRAELRAFF